MKCVRPFTCNVFVLALVLASALDAAAQSVDPAEMIQRSARTRVATTGNPRRSPGNVLKIESPPNVRIQKKLRPGSDVIASILAQNESSTPPKSQPVSLESSSVKQSGSGLAAVVVGSIVAVSLLGTIGLLVLINRLFQHRARAHRGPSVIAPIPFDQSEPEPLQRTIESLRSFAIQENDEQSEMLETAQRYQRGRGEMEFALAIDRLKKESVIPQKRAEAIPRTKSARVNAARKMGKGSGELELAMRLEKLRAASRVATEEE